MLIYAFYSLGKTTFVKNHESIAEDKDEEYFINNSFPKNYRDSISQVKKPLIFVNARKNVLNESEIKMAFIPENMEMVIERLQKRGVDKSFTNELERNKDGILEELKNRFPKAIVVKENEYLSDFEDEIINKLLMET